MKKSENKLIRNGRKFQFILQPLPVLFSSGYFYLQATGASIQVASEMLPSSTERAVTISGSAESIVLCMRHICQILLEVKFF